ncbi:glycosyltransferase [Microbulbifer sp. SAOS-129_SWC]|uniref:glycosyltransferase n=1 Tax=Microbulbifer sp. SAOS-129_SWC TaxID=3145235 RepID=UPI003216D218
MPELNGGANDKAALDFACELVRMGHESIVISNGGELVSRLTLRGGQHFELPMHKKSFLSRGPVQRLRRLLRELRADVVQVRGRVPARVTWRAWRGLPEAERPQLVSAVHSVEPGSYCSAALAAGSQVIAASQQIAERLQAQFGKKLQRVPRVIYRGVNTRELDRRAPISGHWQQRLLNDYPQLEGRHWLMMAAPLCPGRGQETFLQLLAALAQERADVFGLMVGNTAPGQEKYARKLEQLALDLGLSDKVLFLGERRDMRELYASARVCVQLAANGDAGDQAAEALAMDCPVVAYRDGDVAELLQHCFPQGLVARDDFDALLTACQRVLERPQSIDFSGFSLGETAAQTLALYEEICSPA